MRNHAILLIFILAGLAIFPGCGSKPSTNTGPTSFTAPRDEKGVVKRVQPTPEKAEKMAHSAYPWLEHGVGIDGKPIAGGPGGKMSAVHKPGEEFNRKYSDGLRLMDKEDYGQAMQVFEEIVKNYPGSEEASFAEYRIAQIHFRNKSNNQALESYKKIVITYPNSPIAENARAAVTYLESFEKHEKEYISPENDDKRRRGF